MQLRQTTDHYGFRYRGGENSRIEAFTDAAFAFAVTLLMIGGGHVPGNVAQLLAALRQLPGYAASFVLLCLFWYAHYLWYRRYGVEDRHSIVFSLLLVFLVLIFVYPLHMMFSAAIFSAGGSAGTAAFQVRSWSNWKIMYEVFGVAYASMSAVILMLYLHAQRLGGELDLDGAERLVTRAGILRWAICTGVGLGSALLAAAMDLHAVSDLYVLPGLFYMLLALTGPLLRRRLQRGIAAIGARA